MSVISVAVEKKAVMAEDLSKRKDEQDEPEGRSSTLGDSMGDKGVGGFAFVDGDVLMSVREIRVEPGEGGSGYAQGVVRACEEDGMVAGIDC